MRYRDAFRSKARSHRTITALGGRLGLKLPSVEFWLIDKITESKSHCHRFTMHDLNLAQLKHHAAIGGVALKWTHLENYVQSILWRIARLDRTVGRCITHHMPFTLVCNAIVTIAYEQHEFRDFAPELEKLFRECDLLRVKRNDTVHSLWAIFLHPQEEGNTDARIIRPGEVEGMVIKARGRLKITINSTTVAQIDDIIEEIMVFTKKLSNFVTENIPEKDVPLGG